MKCIFFHDFQERTKGVSGRFEREGAKERGREREGERVLCVYQQSIVVRVFVEVQYVVKRVYI